MYICEKKVHRKCEKSTKTKCNSPWIKNRDSGKLELQTGTEPKCEMN